MSKKIMFSDKYGLTAAVLNGTKTMTRRMVPQKILEKCVVSGEAMLHAPFQVGEIVAIAQSYKEIGLTFAPYQDTTFQKKHVANWGNTRSMKGWNNKMYVRADLMAHHIRITNIRVELLQEISEEDCLKEGVMKSDKYAMPYGIPDSKAPNGVFFYYTTAREAFSALIDKVGKKGDWNKNPWVYVYEFELVD